MSTQPVERFSAPAPGWKRNLQLFVAHAAAWAFQVHPEICGVTVNSAARSPTIWPLKETLLHENQSSPNRSLWFSPRRAPLQVVVTPPEPGFSNSEAEAALAPATAIRASATAVAMPRVLMVCKVIPPLPGGLGPPGSF